MNKKRCILGFSSLVLFLLFLNLSLISAKNGYAYESDVPAGGKKVGFMGNPSQKRGLEIGYDRGYQDAKADAAQGLNPDPNRHQDLKEANNYYRYEFGPRAVFVSGFRGGYLGGYRKAYEKSIAKKTDPAAPGSTLPLVHAVTVDQDQLPKVEKIDKTSDDKATVGQVRVCQEDCGSNQSPTPAAPTVKKTLQNNSIAKTELHTSPLPENHEANPALIQRDAF